MEARDERGGDVVITIPKRHQSPEALSHHGHQNAQQSGNGQDAQSDGHAHRAEIGLSPVNVMEGRSYSLERKRSGKKSCTRHGGHRKDGSRKGQQHSPTNGGSEGDGDVLSGDLNCRICMDAVSSQDIAAGRALHLGCKCHSGLDVVHLSCAKKWFRIRRSAVCEVCEDEAKNLPQELKNEVRALAQAAEAVRLEESRTQMRFLARSRRESLSRADEVHLCTYTTFCLLPAALSAILMVVVYYEFLSINVIPTMVLAILVSSVTMLHWLAEPNKPILHIVFVLFFLLTIVGTTFFFVEVHGWGSLAASILGAVVGGLFSTGLYAAFRAGYALWRIEHNIPQPGMNNATRATETIIPMSPHQSEPNSVVHGAMR